MTNFQFILIASNQDDVIASSAIFNDEIKFIEQFSELMAQLEPGRLASYVQLVDMQHLSYLLVICKRYSCIEAEATILERQGEIMTAYELLLDYLRNIIQKLFVGEESWTTFQGVSQLIIDFCQRQAGSLTEAEREKVWLTLLDELLVPQRNVQNKSNESLILSGKKLMIFYLDFF